MRLADQLIVSLARWNTVCTLSEQVDYRDWLAACYPHWQFVDDFSALRVETVDEMGTNMLSKSGLDYLCWFTPEGVMNTPHEFSTEGLLMIGSSPCGDPLVIDTLGATGLELGFVAHEKLWEDSLPPRKAFQPWPDTLLTFLECIWSQPDYVTY